MILPAITDADKAFLLHHLSKRIGEHPKFIVGDMPFNIVACVRDARITAVVAFLNYRRESMEFHLAVDPGGIARSEIKALFAYPFEQIGVLRLWCLIRRNNKKAREGALRLGFKQTGMCPDEFGHRKDGVEYSMRRCDCRWLKQKDKDNG